MSRAGRQVRFRAFFAALAAALLATPWLLVPSFGPTPTVLQACLAGLVLLLWLGVAKAPGQNPPRTPALALALPLALAWSFAAVVNGVIAIAQSIGTPGTEVHGLLRQRNQLATLLGIGLLSLCFLQAQAQARRLRGLLLAAAVLLSVAAALTSSRTASMHWVLVTGFTAWLAARQLPAARWTALVALATHLAVLAAAPWLQATTAWDRVETAPACVSRLVLWRNALHLAGERFWTGWGLGEFDYAHYATLYPGERFCLIADNAHNLFLHVAVELGVPAAVALAVGLSIGVWRAQPWRERRTDRLLCWGVLALVGVHSLVEYPLWYGPFQLAVAVCVVHLLRTRGGAAQPFPLPGEGLNGGPREEVSLARGGPLPHTPPWAVGIRWLRVLALCACALALAWIAWDYHRIAQLYLAPDKRLAAYRVQPLAHARESALFRQQVDFAEFTTTPLNAGNAARLAVIGERALHYSPEPRVIEKLIDALRLAGDESRVQWHRQRFEAAFPQAHASWLLRQRSQAVSN